MRVRRCGKCGAKIKVMDDKIVIEQEGLKPLCDECLKFLREVRKK